MNSNEHPFQQSLKSSRRQITSSVSIVFIFSFGENHNFSEKQLSRPRFLAPLYLGPRLIPFLLEQPLHRAASGSQGLRLNPESGSGHKTKVFRILGS